MNRWLELRQPATASLLQLIDAHVSRLPAGCSSCAHVARSTIEARTYWRSPRD